MSRHNWRVKSVKKLTSYGSNTTAGLRIFWICKNCQKEAYKSCFYTEAPGTWCGEEE